MKSRLIAFATLAGMATLGSIAHAGFGAGSSTPGSLLVFPAFDNRVENNGARNLTLVTVTNTNPTASIEIHYVYRNEDCLETNRSRILTANDTISVITAFDNPNQTQGYLYVYATDRVTHVPVRFDWLVGTQQDLRGEIDDVTDSSFEYAPYIFKAGTRIAEGAATDIDHDGLRDLNGLEYERSPDVLLVPRFFGQDQGNNNPSSPSFRSELVLVNITGGRLFDATVDFQIFNDNEDVFSAQYNFRCWSRVSLLDIDGVFGNAFLKNNTNQNANEVAGGGPNFPETGWFTIDGLSADSSAAHFDDPAILAVRIENDVGESRCGGALIPFALGTQENGDLLPLSLFGDTSP